MKRKFFTFLISIWLVLVLLFLCGCSGNHSGKPEPERYDVVASIFPAYDFARAVGGDRLKIKMLISPGSEVHGYSPTLDELEEIQNCKLFIYTGGETDSWADEQFKSGNLDTSAFKTLALTDCVALAAEADELENEEDDTENAEQSEEYDEHVWTSPANAVALTEKICDLLCEIKPEDADYFKANCASYVSEIKAEDDVIHAIVENAKNKLLVFENRFPFLYFCEHYGLDHLAAFAGCSSNTEISAATMETLVGAIKDNNLPCILCLEFSKQETADNICAAAGCKKAELHSYHNITIEDFNNGVTYVDLMKRNAEVLKEALN